MNDNKINLENILYGYYIKYDKLKELVEEAYALTNPSQYIDIYIDVFDMVKPIYGNNTYTNKKYCIVSSVINLAAHMREYFATRHRMNTRIFLVYADNTAYNHKRCYNNFGDDSYMNTYTYMENKESIDGQMEMIRIISAYLQDIYFVKRTSMFPMFVYDNILKNINTPSLIITKNKYTFQIPAFIKNSAVFRPKKYLGEDKSYAVHNRNVLFKYYDHIKNQNTLDLLSRINPEHLGLLFTLTGFPKMNVKGVFHSAPMGVRKLYEAISNYKILNSYMASSKFIYDNISDITGYITYSEFSGIYSACDLIYQHKIYQSTPEALDESWNLNLRDPDAIISINDKYFIDNPLDLYSL